MARNFTPKSSKFVNKSTTHDSPLNNLSQRFLSDINLVTSSVTKRKGVNNIRSPNKRTVIQNVPEIKSVPLLYLTLIKKINKDSLLKYNTKRDILSNIESNSSNITSFYSSVPITSSNISEIQTHKSCACGSSTHLRRTHIDCPLKKVKLFTNHT